MPNPLISFEFYCYELEVSLVIQTHGRYLVESLMMNSSWCSYRPVVIIISALYSSSVYDTANNLTKKLAEKLKDWNIIREEIAECLKRMTT
jgi:hypothetical protein